MGNPDKNYSIWDYIGGILVAFLVGAMFLQVISRYALRLSLPWPEEFSRYVFIWVVMLGSVTGIITGGHFVLGILSKPSQKKEFQRLVMSMVDLLSCLFLLLLVIYGAKLTYMVRLQHSPAMQVSMGLVYAAIPVGAFLMLVYMTMKFINRWRKSYKATEPAGEKT